jgi:hypothetical protein
MILMVTCILVIPSAQADGKFKFKETYKQKVVWDTWFDWWTTMDFGQIKINAKVPITEADTSQFDKKTVVWITVGDDEYGTRFSFYSDLGEGGYGAGGNSAYYSFSEVDWEGRRHEYLWITLKWNKKWLKVKITGITEPYGFLSSILAYDYYWEDYVGGISKDLWANITVGAKSQDFYMNCAGISKMKTKKKSWDEFDVYKIKVKGVGY